MVLCPFLSCPLETNDDLLLLCDLGPHPWLIYVQLHKVEHDHAVKTRGKVAAKSTSCIAMTTKCLLLKCYHSIQGEAHFNKVQRIFQHMH